MELEKSLLRRRGALAAVVIDQMLGKLALGRFEIEQLSRGQNLGEAVEVGHFNLTLGAFKFEDGTRSVGHFQISGLVVGFHLLLECTRLRIELFDLVFHLVVQLKERTLLLVGKLELFDEELVLILADFSKPTLAVGISYGHLRDGLHRIAQAHQGEGYEGKKFVHNLLM